MSTTKINIFLPDDVLYEIKSMPENRLTIEKRFQMNMAISMFSSK